MKIFNILTRQIRSISEGLGNGSIAQNQGNTNANVRITSVPAQPVNVNSSEKAMQLAAVYRCVSILSGT